MSSGSLDGNAGSVIALRGDEKTVTDASASITKSLDELVSIY
jgi:hypothetical protein